MGTEVVLVEVESYIFIMNSCLAAEQPMATTSLSLGPHWENFIRGEIATGRYASASEVVRAALREYEHKVRKLDALRAHLAEGVEQANRGDFVDDFDVEPIVSSMDAHRR